MTKEIVLKDKLGGRIFLTLRDGVVVGAMGSDPGRFMGLTLALAEHLARYGGFKKKGKGKAKAKEVPLPAPAKAATVIVYSRPSGYWYAQAFDATTGKEITDASDYSREAVLRTLRGKFAMIGVTIKSVTDSDPYKGR